MKPHITLTWNPENYPEAIIKASPSFNDLSWVEKADFLKDCIYDLDVMYKQVLWKKDSEFLQNSKLRVGNEKPSN